MNVETSAPKPQSHAAAASSQTIGNKADRRANALQPGGFSNFLAEALNTDVSQPETVEATRSADTEAADPNQQQADTRLESGGENTVKPTEKPEQKSDEAKSGEAAASAPQTEKKDEVARPLAILDANLLRTQTSTATVQTAQVENTATAQVSHASQITSTVASLSNAVSATAGPAGPSVRAHGLNRQVRADADSASGSRKLATVQSESRDPTPGAQDGEAQPVQGSVMNREDQLAIERNRRFESPLATQGGSPESEQGSRNGKSAAPLQDFASLLNATQVLPPSNTPAIDLNPNRFELPNLAPASYEIPIGPGAPGFGEAVASQLSSIITNSDNRAEIQLNPRELGPIRVEVTLKDKDTQVVLSASQPQTLAALEQSAPQLRSLLSEQGLNLSQFEIAAGFGNADRGGQSASGSSQQGNSRSSGFNHDGATGRDGSADTGTVRTVASRRLLDLFA